MLSRLVCVCAALTLLSCSDEGGKGSGGKIKEGETSIEITDDGKCPTVGPVGCYCPDGNGDGMQFCDVAGTLTACSCPDPMMSGGTSGTSGGTSGSGSMPVEGDLCPELQSMSDCEASQYQAEELPASVLFLVDRSGSMNCNLPPLQTSEACEMDPQPTDPDMPTKWEITVDALKEVFSDLLAQKTTASIGLSFFSTDAACGVDAVPTVNVATLNAEQNTALAAALDAVEPDGATPIVGSVTLAYKYLHEEANRATGCKEPCGAHGNRYVVLITDGADSCGSPMDGADSAACTAAGGCTNLLLATTAPQALEANIKTFVIGSPGSEPARGFLSSLAFAGGTARSATCAHTPTGDKGDCHFDMTKNPESFADDLAMALSDISGAALSCEFAVPDTGVPITPTEVNVQYKAMGTGAPVCMAKDDSKACDAGASGWQFKKNADGSDDLTHVVLCGSACDMIRNDQKASVEVIRGCQSLLE